MSITNFEQHTAELNKDELAMLQAVIDGFRKHGETNPIKAPVIVTQMNEYLSRKKSKLKMNEVRLRKFCNYIRSNSLLPLIATSDGYYVSDDHEKIRSQIKSLRERASSISKCADGLTAFLPVHNL